MQQALKNDDKLVHIVVGLFAERYLDNCKAAKTEVIISALSKLGIDAKGRDLRRVIGYIRHNDLLAPNYILSDVNKGYWLSTDKAEMSSFLEKQLNRMTNQFQNLKLLHQRIRYSKSSAGELQTKLF